MLAKIHNYLLSQNFFTIKMFFDIKIAPCTGIN